MSTPGNQFSLPFTVRNGHVVLLGADVEARLYEDKCLKVPKAAFPEGCFESEPLCVWQGQVHAAGFRAARLDQSVHGWSVRSASGLDNFRLLAAASCGNLDGSFADALKWARAWMEEAPGKRYVLTPDSPAFRAAIEPLLPL